MSKYNYKKIESEINIDLNLECNTNIIKEFPDLYHYFSELEYTYNNIKQGRNATDKLNTAPFYTMLKNFCTLEEKGGKYYSYDADGTEQFHMAKPKMEFIEADKLELSVTFTMYIPIRFAGATVSTAEVPVKITSELTSKN